MHRICWTAALALLLAACAPKNYVVLLDNPEGGAGQVTISTDKGQQTLDTSGSAVAMNRSSRPPSEPWEFKFEKLTRTFAKAFGARPAQPEYFTLYFELGSTRLTEGSNETLVEIVKSLRNHPAPDCDVQGHADRSDTNARNDRLALARAEIARSMLMHGGVPRERITMNAYGELRPAVPTADGVREPLNRRVEIIIR